MLAAMFHPEGPSLLELLGQAFASTEQGYDLLASKFERTPFRTPDPVLEGMAKVIGESGPVETALDVCCGTGAAMRYLRPLCTERLVGLDFSAGMLAEAERQLEGAPGSAAIELVRGDALALGYDGAFDVVTSVGAFGHVRREDEGRFVAGIARALRPGGRFVFATGTRPHATSPWFWMAHGFNAAMRVRNALRKPEFVMYYLTFLWPDVQPLLEEHGFSCEAVAGATPAPYERVLVVVATKRARA